MGNSGCLPRRKPAEAESRYPTAFLNSVGQSPSKFSDSNVGALSLGSLQFSLTNESRGWKSEGERGTSCILSMTGISEVALALYALASSRWSVSSRRPISLLTALTTGLRDWRQTVVHAPVSTDRTPVQRGRIDKPHGLPVERGHHLL